MFVNVSKYFFNSQLNLKLFKVSSKCIGVNFRHNLRTIDMSKALYSCSIENDIGISKKL